VRQRGEELVLRAVRDLRGAPRVLLAGEGQRERPRGSIVLEGHRRRARERLDGLDLRRRRLAPLPEVRPEGAEHLAGAGHDRHGPRALEPEREGKMREAGPPGRGGDVRSHDHAAARRRGGARADIGVDAQSIDRAHVACRQAGARAIVQAPVLVEQEDARHGAAALLLDHAAQGIEHVADRLAAHDHLERAMLAGSERLHAAALGDVA
jgi:hypothetical protein